MSEEPHDEPFQPPHPDGTPPFPDGTFGEQAGDTERKNQTHTDQTQLGEQLLESGETDASTQDQDDEMPDTVIQDPDLAVASGHLEYSRRTVEAMADNVEQSRMPDADKEALVEKLRDHASELEEQAVSEYEAAQERYKKASDRLIGNILGLSEDKIDPNAALSVVEYDANDGNPLATDKLTSYQINQLLEVLSSTLGIEPINPSEYWEYGPGRTTVEYKLFETGFSGIKVIIGSDYAAGYLGPLRENYHDQQEHINIRLTRNPDINPDNCREIMTNKRIRLTG